MRASPLLLAAALGLLLPAAALAGRIVSGPLQGPPRAGGADLWLMAEEARTAALEYWPQDQPAAVRRSAPQAVEAARQEAVTLRLEGLEPGRRYEYRVLLDGAAAHAQPRLLHAAPPGAEPPLRLLLGSCAHLRDDADSGRPFSEGYHVFDEMAARGGDLMLWLGDNHYYREADTRSPEGMAARWVQVRRHPSLQGLLRALPHAAIWDDHDFGPNDSHREFASRDDSLALFRRHWPQPPGGTPATPGIFQKLSLGDVDLFLLDSRYHRDPLARAAGGGLYGAAQLAWLRRELLASRAAFKLVAGGTQFLNDSNRFEDWHHYPRERGEFLDWLRTTRIEGLLFLSGDRHHTELLRHERQGAYPLYELTCSPLTSRLALPRDEQDNPLRAPGTLVVERNWCEISLGGKGSARRLRVSVFNNEGFELWHRDFSHASLSWPRPPAGAAAP